MTPAPEETKKITRASSPGPARKSVSGQGDENSQPSNEAVQQQEIKKPEAAKTSDVAAEPVASPSALKRLAAAATQKWVIALLGLLMVGLVVVAAVHFGAAEIAIHAAQKIDAVPLKAITVGGTAVAAVSCVGLGAWGLVKSRRAAKAKAS